MPTWFKLLRIEADLAMTFIDLARNHTGRSITPKVATVGKPPVINGFAA
jgi:hypothetical protein